MKKNENNIKFSKNNKQLLIYLQIILKFYT